MSLIVDEIFYNALKKNPEIMKMTGGRIYSTAITVPPTEQDNVSTPYVIIMFDGGSNDLSTKDDYEGFTDSVNVTIEVVADNRRSVGVLMQKIRDAVRKYFYLVDMDEGHEDYALLPMDYSLNFSGVSWDWTKPCYWQTMTYQCSTHRD